MLDVASYLAARIQDQTGLRLPVNLEDETGIERFIYLDLPEAGDGANEEAYSLSLNRDSVILSSGTPEGLFRGVQTLRQLIPFASNDTLAEQPIWPLAGGRIDDLPNVSRRPLRHRDDRPIRVVSVGDHRCRLKRSEISWRLVPPPLRFQVVDNPNGSQAQ